MNNEIPADLRPEQHPSEQPVPEPLMPAKTPILGAMPDLIVHMAEDFDAPLDDFAEYMS